MIMDKIFQLTKNATPNKKANPTQLYAVYMKHNYLIRTHRKAENRRLDKRHIM